MNIRLNSPPRVIAGVDKRGKKTKLGVDRTDKIEYNRAWSTRKGYIMAEILNVEQVAERLQCSTYTVMRKVRLSKLPCVGTGKEQKRFIWEDVLDWMKAGAE